PPRHGWFRLGRAPDRFRPVVAAGHLRGARRPGRAHPPDQRDRQAHGHGQAGPGDAAERPRVRCGENPMTPLSIDALTVRFGGLVAVDSVTLSLAPKEVVGLVGTNGAGKSTLLAAVAGAVP